MGNNGGWTKEEYKVNYCKSFCENFFLLHECIYLIDNFNLQYIIKQEHEKFVLQYIFLAH